MLKTTECILINHSGMEYTDCMEFSLLRFLQILLFDPNEIDDHEFSCYHVPSDAIRIHPSLVNYVKENPFIYPDALYYVKSPSGIKERCDWAKLVSFHKQFQYYRNDSAELFTNIDNIFMFLQFFCGLTPKQMGVPSQKHLYASNKTIDEYNLIFAQIGKLFSTPAKHIHITVFSQHTTIQYMTIQGSTSYISRPENTEYYQSPHNQHLYRVKRVVTKIRFCINEWYTYDWDLYEIYFDAEQDQPLHLHNRLLTGHSVIARHTTIPATRVGHMAPNEYDETVKVNL